jgi:hypothetical protein
VTDIATGRSVQFIAYGTPAPQGSKRGFNHPSTGKVILLEQAGAKLKDWRSDVRHAAWEAMAARPPPDRPPRHYHMLHSSQAQKRPETDPHMA